MISIPKPVKLIPDVLEITDYENSAKGPCIEMKLLPFDPHEKFKYLVQGRAKLLGLHARVKTHVSSANGVELGFQIENNLLGDVIKFNNDFSLVLSPERPLKLRNELEFRLNLRLPSIDCLGIPAFNLFSVKTHVVLELSSTSFLLNASLKLNVFKTEMNLSFDYLRIEKCSLIEMPARLAQKIVEKFPSVVGDMGSSVINGIVSAVTSLARVVGDAIKTVFVYVCDFVRPVIEAIRSFVDFLFPGGDPSSSSPPSEEERRAAEAAAEAERQRQIEEQRR